MKLTRISALALAIAVVLGVVFSQRADEAPALLLPHSSLPYAGSVARVGEGAPDAERWAIVYHGTCCEGNMAAAGDSVYVLLPELTAGNDILRSDDSGLTWTKNYPPLPVPDPTGMGETSVPYGIEGDLLAWGNDVIYFGTELAIGAVAFSDNRGDDWTVVQVPVTPVVNDQAWGYLGPLADVCPIPQSKPYVLAGWFRIGGAVIFSCDGGMTWPIQTALVGNNGSGPRHVVCEQNAVPAADAGDTRVADANFSSLKAGRHGTWGTDRRFYWTDVFENQLYVCRTDDFGINWEGNTHPIADNLGAGYTVTHSAFDEKGTLYVMHGEMIYVSFDQGQSFRYSHRMPRYDNAGRSDSGAGQYFALHNGRVHVAIIEIFPDDAQSGRIVYLRGRDLDTETARWHAEPVDITGPVRLDFMQIALGANGVPVMSYTTPDEGGESREVTTAALRVNTPYAALLATPLSGDAPLEVAFDARESSDLEAEPLTYDYDFGDGSSLKNGPAQTTRNYTKPGTYTARVTVTNPQGDSSEASVDITVGEAKAARNQGRFGGALPLSLLMVLLLGVWRRGVNRA